ncbi:MAG: nucleoside monophosphate kinase [bacterium]|nr:nucleoside monophosphate kinase [bacterium]
MNIILLGPAGSGKSTQAKILGEELGLPVLSAGDLLYFASQSDNPESKNIVEKMQKGELVDHDIMVRFMEEHLAQNEHSKGTIIDGFPRSLIEAEKFSVKIEKVIHIKVSDVEVKKRLFSRGRSDDSESVINNRIKIYHEEVGPVVEYYREKGILAEIDGEQEINTIASQIRGHFI